MFWIICVLYSVLSECMFISKLRTYVFAKSIFIHINTNLFCQIVKSNLSPIGKVDDDEVSARQNSVEHEIVNQAGKPSERMDAKQLDDNKNIKGKRGAGAKADSNIQCTQCMKKFGSSSALAKHKATHSDERKYICSICEKGFKRQDHL